jgi:hypothetical protein
VRYKYTKYFELLFKREFPQKSAEGEGVMERAKLFNGNKVFIKGLFKQQVIAECRQLFRQTFSMNEAVSKNPWRAIVL